MNEWLIHAAIFISWTLFLIHPPREPQQDSRAAFWVMTNGCVFVHCLLLSTANGAARPIVGRLTSRIEERCRDFATAALACSLCGASFCVTTLPQPIYALLLTSVLAFGLLFIVKRKSEQPD